ncbi:TonB family protein [Marilutibacter alkalisoli]|nr:TonB family protein [Lysobacter alkalisoli]
MNAADLIGLLLETTLAAGAAIVVVLLVRRSLRQVFGAGVAYAAWLMVPAVLVAVLLPAREAVTGVLPMFAIIPIVDAIVVPTETASFDFVPVLAVAWVSGTIAMGLRLLLQQRAFSQALGPLRRRDDGSHQATTIAGLPAAIGLLRPRIVVPADFDDRYSTDQRALMQLHERTHIRRGDLHLNALVALLRCIHWFNPLVHLAARHFRHDQELACDQRVLSRHPHHRRAYGEAMLHTQLASQPLPIGCHWGFSHPLRERIEMLKQNPKSTKRIATGAVLVTALAIATGAVAWAAQPERAVTVAGTAMTAQGEHVIGLRARLDGHEETTSGRVMPGREVIYPFNLNGQHWQVALTITSRDDETYDIASRILRDGELQAAPSLIVKVGEDSGITIGGNANGRPGKGFELGLVVQHADAIAHREEAGTSSQEKTPPPKYPAAAAKENIGGRVVLLLDVDAQGRVTGVEVEKAEPAGVFDQVSIEAARTWTFNPATENGVAVPGRVRVPVDFAPDAPAAEVPTVNMMPAAPGQS